jgi:hypothetical protein
MIKRVLTLVNAMQCIVLPHITASVFINDDESGLHHDYEVWLEKVCSRLHPAPHAPIDQAGPEAGCTTPPANAHLKRNATRSVACDGPRGGCGDQRPPGWFRFAHQSLWHVRADLLGPGGRAGPGILTASGGSVCWSRSSVNRCAQSYPDIDRRQPLCLVNATLLAVTMPLYSGSRILRHLLPPTMVDPPLTGALNLACISSRGTRLPRRS